jgi:hypothetical protein
MAQIEPHCRCVVTAARPCSCHRPFHSQKLACARRTNDHPQLRTYARVAGALYLINFILAGVAPVHVLPRLVVAGDAAATATNITASAWMLHVAVASDLIAVLCEVALCALLYVLFRQVDRTLALFMAFLRLAYAAVLTTNILNLFTPLRLLTDDSYLTAFSAGELPALAMLSIDAYHDTFAIALTLFGVHILTLGYLLYKSGYVPRVLGAWLMSGAPSFFAYSFGNLAVPGVAVPLLVVAPVALAELTFLLLLLFNRVNVPTPAHETV